jgi:ubiquinone/menaquinone biosynthesis C-methylase UbiE
MASQYDAIGSKYDSFKTLPTSAIEEASFKEAIQPWLAKFPHARVLDLACGTGFYSRKLLDWGAGYVLGVDSSTGMVDAAKGPLRRDSSYTGRLNFRVGNALDLGKVDDEGPFHIVVGVWLLNYAGDLGGMTSMYRTISANLEDGGVFIAVTPPPVEDLDDFVKSWTNITTRYMNALPVQVDYYEKLESGEGWKTEIRSLTEGAQYSFRNFHLRKTVYEEAARSGGLDGKLEWKEPIIPEQVVTATDALSKMCVEVRHIGVLIVEK